MEQKIKRDYVTIFLVIMNIAFFIIYTILGNVLYNRYSLSVRDLLENQEYYRVLSSMFMHASVEHLAGNLLFLAVLGDMLEPVIGHVTLGVLYLLSGIGGNLLSMQYELSTGQFYHTVGASGAICGLIGMLLFLVVENRGTFGSVSLPRIILACFYLIYSGLRTESVNNAAHVGGMAAGFVLMLLVSIIKRIWQNRNL